MKWSFFHPFLIAIAPILFLCAHNSDQVELNLVLAILGAALIFAGVLLGIAYIAFRNLGKAALAASLFLVLFFLFGHWFNVIWSWRIIQQSQYIEWALLAISAVILAGGVWLIARSKRDLRQLSTGLAIAGLLVVGMSVVRIVKESRIRGARETIAARSTTRPAPLTQDSPQTPDIYYFILDAYAQKDVLKKHYKFDNSEFLAYLRDKGFYVADESLSNYPLTFLSLASSVNMEYLNDEMKRIHQKGWSRRPIYDMAKRPKTARFLQDRGYRYVHFNTSFNVTESSPIADITYRHLPEWLANEFTTVLMRTSAMRLFQPHLANQHLFQFEKVQEVPKIAGPTFTFSHFLVPHFPFVFDRDGNIRRRIPLELQWMEGERWTANEEYVDQLIYVNKRMTEVIDRLIADSPVPPIIIIQADHGSARTYADSTKSKKNQRRYVRERFPILNAYYVPENVKQKLYPTITPVNSFRLLFNELFGAEFKLLRDEAYYTTYKKPYELKNVTDVVRRQPTTASVASAAGPTTNKSKRKQKPATQRAAGAP